MRHDAVGVGQIANPARAPFPVHVEPVKDDGNCLFRSLMLHEYLVNKHKPLLRYDPKIMRVTGPTRTVDIIDHIGLRKILVSIARRIADSAKTQHVPEAAKFHLQDVANEADGSSSLGRGWWRVGRLSCYRRGRSRWR